MCVYLRVLLSTGAGGAAIVERTYCARLRLQLRVSFVERNVYAREFLPISSFFDSDTRDEWHIYERHL